MYSLVLHQAMTYNACLPTWSSLCSCAANKASPAVDNCSDGCADDCAAGIDADGAVMFMSLPAATWTTLSVVSSYLEYSIWEAGLRLGQTNQLVACVCAGNYQQVSRDFIAW